MCGLIELNKKRGEISELVDREIIAGLIEEYDIKSASDIQEALRYPIRSRYCKEYDIQLSDPALGRPRKDEIRDKTQDSVRFFADACAFDSGFCAEGK